MKKMFKTTLVLAFVAISSWVSAQYNLVGEWYEVDGKDTSSFTFHKNGFVSILAPADELEINGESFDLEGFNACAKYKAEQNGKMAKVNIYIILVDMDSAVAMIAPALIEFTDANTIKLAMNMEHEETGDLSAAMLEKLRPKDFNDPDETVILKRRIKK